MSVVGNKLDLSDKRVVSRDRGEEFAHSLGAMFTETSAADNIGQCPLMIAISYIIVGVKEAFLKVAQGVIEQYQNHLLSSATINSSSVAASGTVSPMPPRHTNNDVYLYQTRSIGEATMVAIVVSDYCI